MAGMYDITCKPEYWNTWVAIFKEEIAEFATVEIVHPAHMRTVPENMNVIVSPSGNFSATISLANCTPGNEGCNVYVVSDGGYLVIGEFFDEARTFIDIIITSGKRVNKQIYYEMYEQTTSILNKMAIDYKPLH
jgi:hypothetical protein